MSTLVLAPDYQPVNFLPLSTIGWETAVKLHFLDKVNVIEWYEDWTIHSARMEMKVPAVVVVKNNFKRRRHGLMRFTKHNLFLRDLYTCQYCLETFSTKDLTVDHVVPYSRGGKTSWDNCVAACHDCNSKKGSKLWAPVKQPTHPDYWKLVKNVKQTTLNVQHPSWENYLGLQLRSA
jgi:5-methylcytosine-specific restriction endonuclease McrA